MNDRPPPAAPAAGSVPGTAAGSVGDRARPLRVAGHGALAALALLGTGAVVSVAEYIASGGRYHLWTWVKVAIMYALAFCGVGFRAVAGAGEVPAGVPELHMTFRLPLFLGAGGFVWLLFRLGRRIGGPQQDLGPRIVAFIAAAAGAALPLFLASFAVSLRFPELLNAVVTPVPWESAAFPLLVAAAAIGAGGYVGWRERAAAAGPPARVAAWIDGGWRMFTTALALAFLGFLILAAVNPTWTGRYARAAQGAGRTGAVVVLHHVLLLPAQTALSLAPAMGGQLRVTMETGAGATTASLRQILPTPALGAVFGGGGEDASPIPLGGAWYAFLLVPAVATVVGGRRAGALGGGAASRLVDGAVAGAMFCVLVTGGCCFATTVLPLLTFGFVPLRIAAPVGSTAALALAWGVIGGALGALTVTGAKAQTPVPEPGLGDDGPGMLTSL